MSAAEVVLAVIYAVWVATFLVLVVWGVSRVVRGVWQRFRSS